MVGGDPDTDRCLTSDLTASLLALALTRSPGWFLFQGSLIIYLKPLSPSLDL